MFGQEHFYTVILRGNGEAAIHSKFIFTNTEEATMSAMTLKTPDIAVKDIVGYQVIREPQCDEFEPVKYLPYNPDVTPTPYVQPKCRKYGEPDYYNQYFYGKTSYKKLKIAISGDQINVSLPEKVSPEKSGSIIMYYHTDNYTQKEFGGTYKYEIKTLSSAKLNSPTNSLHSSSEISSSEGTSCVVGCKSFCVIRNYLDTYSIYLYPDSYKI
jgi:hypothetical protein